jgi:hypothetical protein
MGTMSELDMHLQEIRRVVSKTEVVGSCWIWMAYKDANGYGKVGISGRV